jgi:hypothetical protein
MFSPEDDQGPKKGGYVDKKSPPNNALGNAVFSKTKKYLFLWLT